MQAARHDDDDDDDLFILLSVLKHKIYAVFWVTKMQQDCSENQITFEEKNFINSETYQKIFLCDDREHIKLVGCLGFMAYQPL